MKKIYAIAIFILLLSTMAFAAQEFKFNDGTLIRGEIQEERVHVKTQFGDLYPKVSEIVFISSGKIELNDGSQVMGELLSEPPSEPEATETETSTSEQKKGLSFKTKYGTFELLFSMDNIEYIDFKK